MSDVTRRASLLWPASNRKSPYHPSRGGLGNHAVLRSQESLDVPMNDLNHPPSPSASAPPSPTPSTPDISITAPDSPQDPFANPTQGSPFEDTSQPTAAGSQTLLKPPGKSRVFAASASKQARVQVPPPKPLGLPPPRTPPPPLDAVPHEAVAQGVEEDVREVRWWHEWLCGCGEGSDRGGDNQASLFFFCVLGGYLLITPFFRPVGRIRSSRIMIIMARDTDNFGELSISWRSIHFTYTAFHTLLGSFAKEHFRSWTSLL